MSALRGAGFLACGCGRLSSRQPQQRGVALIVTLIMLAVITFMATTFLVLSRRERNSVSTNTDQTTARFTADSALERAKVQLLAGILTFTNDQNFDLMVPTNFFNPFGFDPAAVDSRTNVNYGYTAAAGNPPLNALQQQQNIANLLYDPRAPVFITNSKITNDFRYYLDLNRNGRFDDSGIVPEIGTDGLPIVNLGVTNLLNLIGDPQWIGVLRFPDRPHSADNPFVSRWTYIALPAGKTLDVNYIHNQTRNTSLGLNDGFSRNQGVGTWENNLAAFLADLSPDIWWTNNVGAPYDYRQFGNYNLGVAFDDARELLRWRYGNSYLNLDPMSSIFNNSAAFSTDNIDEYSDGPAMVNIALPNETLVVNQDNNPNNRWVGSYNPQHYFTPQDFFNANKNPAFATHLLWAGSSNSSPTRYTFYRMVAQLGTDSAPPMEDKININYRNVTNGMVVSGMATNLYAWTPLEFFTNSAARMFEKLNIRDNNNNLITVTNIPIWAQATNQNNNFYSSTVHRVLQMAANIYDATTNGFFPSIYRPIFSSYAQGGTNRTIYISGYELVNAPNDTVTPVTFLTIPLDLNDSVDNGKILATPTRENVYGAPWVIAAKEGFPSLNQIAMQSVSQMTRKLMINRPTTRSGWAGYRGKQMFVMGISNSLAVSVWNSYNTTYPRALYVRADCKLTVQLTNNVGFAPPPVSFFLGTGVAGETNLPAGTLLNSGLRPPFTKADRQPNVRSFVVPMQTNLIVLQDSVQIGGVMQIASDSTAQWNAIPWDNLTDPHWGLNITNNLRCFVMDGGPAGRVVDYVQLSRLDSVRNLTDETVAQANKLGVWTPTTNTTVRWATPALPISEGVIQQIEISEGKAGLESDWTQNGMAAGTKTAATANFLKFMMDDTVSSNYIQAPFTPTSKIRQMIKWQANDPLVHYLAEDLTYLDNVTNAIVQPPNNSTFEKVTDPFLYKLTDRYSPWGGNGPKSLWDPAYAGDKHIFDTALKDPLVMAADNWNFPTNKFPNVGWLGRVHRGTPWQTAYMKSSDILATDPVAWQKWSGSGNLFLATNIAPIVDRQLFEVFTTALSDNATRGQLSINQTNLAAWSAVLSGVIVLTNDPTISSYGYDVINPAGIYNAAVLPPLAQIVQGINNARKNFANNTFTNLGDILATPQFTDVSPYLVTNNLAEIGAGGITDEVLERIPQQIMSLLTISHSPKFVVYSYGQTLRPANNSVITANGIYNGLVTNYQVVAETATRAVIRVDGAPARPRVVVEQYNVLPPD